MMKRRIIALLESNMNVVMGIAPIRRFLEKDFMSDWERLDVAGGKLRKICFGQWLMPFEERKTALAYFIDAHTHMAKLTSESFLYGGIKETIFRKVWKLWTGIRTKAASFWMTADAHPRNLILQSRSRLERMIYLADEQEGLTIKICKRKQKRHHVIKKIKDK